MFDKEYYVDEFLTPRKLNVVLLIKDPERREKFHQEFDYMKGAGGWEYTVLYYNIIAGEPDAIKWRWISAFYRDKILGALGGMALMKTDDVSNTEFWSD